MSTAELSPWDDLSDDELWTRLVHRGIRSDEAAVLVRARDGSWAARQRIDEVLAT